MSMEYGIQRGGRRWEKKEQKEKTRKRRSSVFRGNSEKTHLETKQKQLIPFHTLHTCFDPSGSNHTWNTPATTQQPRYTLPQHHDTLHITGTYTIPMHLRTLYHCTKLCTSQHTTHHTLIIQYILLETFYIQTIHY